MAAEETRRIVPRGDLQGSLGSGEKRWDKAYVGNVSSVYDTVADMVADLELRKGTSARTKGYASINDGKDGFYNIREKTVDDVDDGALIIFLDNGDVAEYIGESFYIDDTLSTEAIRAICANHKEIYFNDGNYTFTPESDGDYWIAPSSNSHIVFSKNAVVNVTPNAFQHYNVIKLIECDNVLIEGGKLIGDKDDHDYSGGGSHEWCHGVYVTKDASNITVQNMEICEMPGDGAEVNSGRNENVGKNITLFNLHIHDCGRQGISVDDCDGLIISHCYIHDIDRVAPMACIDFEPWLDNKPLKNAIVSDCVFENSIYCILIACQTTGTDVGINIHDITINNSTGCMLRIIGAESVINSGYVYVHDIVASDVQKPIWMTNIRNDGFSVKIDNIKIKNGIFSSDSTDNNTVILFTNASSSSSCGNTSISDVSIDKGDNNIHYMVMNGAILENIEVKVPQKIVGKMIRILTAESNTNNINIIDEYMNAYLPAPEANWKAKHKGLVALKHTTHTFTSTGEETILTVPLTEVGHYRASSFIDFTYGNPTSLAIYLDSELVARNTTGGSMNLETMIVKTASETANLIVKATNGSGSTGSSPVSLTVEKIG